MSFNYPFGPGIVIEAMGGYEVDLQIYGVTIPFAILPQTMHFYSVKSKISETSFYWFDQEVAKRFGQANTITITTRITHDLCG